MGCNCKKTYDTMKKYSDDEQSEVRQSENLLAKCLKTIMKILFFLVVGILCMVLFIVIGVPLIIYIIVCNILGKEPVFNMGKFIKLSKKI